MAGIGRVAFLGSGAFAVPLLEAVARMADDLLVVSAPARPGGRGMRDRASPVAALARRMGATLTTPARLRSPEGRAALDGFAPDGLIVADYGQLVPADLLALAPRPPLNVHPSLLPRHRGAAPVAAAILAGDPETGVSLIVMTAELDAGPIVARWRFPLAGRESAPELEEALARLAAERVPGELEPWASGTLRSTPQDPTAATFTRPLRREDGVIDWTRPAAAIDRQVRALQPWPGAWTTLDGRRIHVRRARPLPAAEGAAAEGSAAAPGMVAAGPPPFAACGQGRLVLETVQPEGRAAVEAAAWLRGLRRTEIRLGT